MSKKTFSSQERLLIDKKQDIKHINLYQPSTKRKNKNSIIKTQESLKKTNDLKNQFKNSIHQKKINFRGTKKQKSNNNSKISTEKYLQQQKSQQDVQKSINQKSKLIQKQNFKDNQDSKLNGEELFQQIYQHLLKNKDKPEVMQQIYQNIFEPQQEQINIQQINSSKNGSDKINFQTSVSDISGFKLPTQSFKMTQSKLISYDCPQKFQSHKLIYDSDVQQQSDFNLYTKQINKPLKITLLQGWTSNLKMGLTCIKFYDQNYQYIEANCQYYINDKLVNRKFSNLFQNLKIKQKETFFNYKVYNVFKFKFKNNQICSAICFWNAMSEPNLGIKKILIEYGEYKNEIKIPKSEVDSSLNKNFYIHKLEEQIDALQLRLKIEKQLINVDFKNTLMPLRKSSSFVNTNQQIETPRFYQKSKLNKTIEFQRELNKQQKKILSLSYDLEDFNLVHNKTSTQIPLLKKSLRPRKNILSISINNQKDTNLQQQNIYDQSTPLFKDDQNFFNYDIRKKSNSLMASEFSKYSMNSTISENQIEDFIGQFQNHQIPKLPKTDGIIIQIQSNWGDKNFLGLNNIEIFNDLGEKINIKQNDLEIFSHSKQGIFHVYFKNENLFNNHIITQQEDQQWKIPLKYKFPIYIKIRFGFQIHISMIRIWNYNVDRINKNIGAKQIIITNIDKDGLLFCGIIKKSLGGSIQLFKNNQETILYTQNTNIIQQISKNDWLFQLIQQKKKQKLKAQCIINDLQIHRPITQDQKQQIQRKSTIKGNSSNQSNITIKESMQCKRVKIIFLDNWGHLKLIGFQQILFLNQLQQTIDQQNFQMKSNLKFTNNNFNFLDRKFLQSDKAKFFQFKKNINYFIEIIFDQEVNLSAIQIKNVCQSNQIQASVKSLAIYIDNNIQTSKEGFFIKKNQLDNSQDQIQTIYFPIQNQFIQNGFGVFNQQPSGFNLKIHLINTYGDLYYIGLNEIDIYDQEGQQIQQNCFKASANPEGVYILEKMEKDQRKVSNLFNNIVQSSNQKDIFLAPLEKSKSLLNYSFYNQINIQFKEPKILGKIIFYNYLKTPLRAVKEIKIFLDDFLLKHDYLNHPQIDQRTIFYFNSNLYEKDNNKSFNISTNNLIENEIQLVNEKQILTKQIDQQIQEYERPQTGANNNSNL